MKRYVTSIKDLTIESLSSFSIIKTSADRGDAESCFKMGMIHLLGINRPADFKKAEQYFCNQSLADDKDSNNLLGLITECEGNYSLAFQKYAKIEADEKNSYLERVIKGRNELQNYLTNLGLPIALNKVISAVLSDYSKGKASKNGATFKIAAICNDEQTCLEAAQIQYDSHNYISAINWLEKGNVGLDNVLFSAINEYFENSKQQLLQSRETKVLELYSDSILSIQDLTPFWNKVKMACDESSTLCKKEWIQRNKQLIDEIVKIQKQNELEEEERLEKKAKERNREKKAQIITIILAMIPPIAIYQLVEEDQRTGYDWLYLLLLFIFFYFLFIFGVYAILEKIDD